MHLQIRHDLVLCYLTRISARKMMTNGWITFSLFIVASQRASNIQHVDGCHILSLLWIYGLPTTLSNMLLEWRQDFTYNTYLLNIYQTKSTALHIIHNVSLALNNEHLEHKEVPSIQHYFTFHNYIPSSIFNHIMYKNWSTYHIASTQCYYISKGIKKQIGAYSATAKHE